jgi:hypothetical protein
MTTPLGCTGRRSVCGMADLDRLGRRGSILGRLAPIARHRQRRADRRAAEFVHVLDTNRTPPPQRNPESLSDTTYGQTIPLSGGRREIRGRILWWTEPRTITVPPVISATDGSPDLYSLVSTGSAANTTATVVDFAVSFGRPLAATGRRDILRLKAGISGQHTVIYDKTGTSPVNAVGLSFVFYQGDEDQLPDPLIEASKGVGETSAYRGQMYAVFRDFPIDLFVEGEAPVIPVIAALIADDAFGTVTTENFVISTGTTINGAPAIDWQGALVFFNGSGDRLVCSNLYGSHAERYDIPLVDCGGLSEIWLFVDGLNAIYTVGFGAGAHSAVLLVDPVTGQRFAEGPDLGDHIFGGFGALGTLAWSVDLTGATPVYLLAALSQTGVLKIYRYDPETGDAPALIGAASTAGLNGRDTSSHAVTAITRHTNDDNGRGRFHVAAGAQLVLVTADVNADTLTYDDVGTAGTRIRMLLALPAQNAVVLFLDDGTASRIECSDYSASWLESVGFTIPNPYAAGPDLRSTETYRRTRNVFGYFTTGGGSAFYLVDLANGATTVKTGTTANGLITFDSETQCFIVSDLGAAANQKFYKLGAAASGAYAFSDLALAIATEAGYADGDVTVTAVDDTFDGVIFDQSFDFREFVYGHAELVNYEVVETESGLTLTRIGNNPTPVATIDNTVCVDGADGPIVINDEQESEVAAEIDIRYRDPALDYALASQTVSRGREPMPETASRRRDVIETPLIMTADQAVTLGTPVLYRRAAGAVKGAATLLPEQAKLEPGDVVTANAGALSYTAKIINAKLAPSFVNQVAFQVILTDVTFSRHGDSGSLLPYAISVKNPATVAYLIDAPLLDRSYDLLGLGLAFTWLASSRGQDLWSGGNLWLSYDRINYAAAPGTQATDPLTGALLTALAANPIPFMTDETNALVVVPLTGDFSELATVAYADVMDNLAYVGAPGRWEVIAYQTVTANADGTYTLTGLRRGCFGSEVFDGDHVAGDAFIPISAAMRHRAAFATAALGERVYYRGVGVRQRVLAAREQTATISGNAERPPAQCHLDAVVSGSDIALSWVKRSRYMRHLNNWDPDDSETADEFEIEILDGADVIRTIAGVTTTAYTYLAADITTDFGALPAELAFRVYRIGNIGTFSIGRGFAAETTVALA